MSKVYFVSDVKRPKLVKIGVAIDPQKRLASIQTGNPHLLEIKACTNGGYHLESALHRAFEQEHHHGEWYVLSSRLAALINELQQIQVDPISEEDARELENEYAADLNEIGLPMVRRVEKYVARHDKHDGEGVAAQAIKDRFNLTDEDIRQFITRLRCNGGRTDYGKPIKDKDKKWNLRNSIFFDDGQADIEHGDPRCRCPWCFNERTLKWIAERRAQQTTSDSTCKST